jgi:ubiquinone/menaquinone biosynthesis C-methylase UbiE
MGSRKKLMQSYPVGKGRLSERPIITDETKIVSKKFGYDYFDGDRKYGYGGFDYHPKFWTKVVEDFIVEYSLDGKSTILDIGCAKGFMLVDFKKSIPSIKVAGVDLSEYAISNSHPIVSQDLIVGNAVQLPFDNDSFELVVSINTLHNLKKIEIKKALQEIERIGYKNKFIMVDGYESELEKEMMNKWVLTAETVLSYREWEDFFSEVGYTGDYDFWTVS